MSQANNPIRFRDDDLSYVTLTIIVLMHVGAVCALFVPSIGGVAALIVLYLISGLGIVVGYHRMLTHGSFRAKKWLERLLVTAGALAFQGAPSTWVGIHRLHHAGTDTDLDPHNAHRGFYFSHIRWIFNALPAEFEDRRYTQLARDVGADPYYRWLSDHHYAPTLAVGALLLLVGGWSVFLWGICLRTVMVYHVTWLVNSASHLWGGKPYPDSPGRNNLFVAVVAMGEGWHNNHHAFPKSAKCGFAWYQVDFGWWVILLMRKLGLVDQVHVAGRNL